MENKAAQLRLCGVCEVWRMKIIKSINTLDWYSAKEEGLGDLYEGLLEKNANEK